MSGDIIRSLLCQAEPRVAPHRNSSLSFLHNEIEGRGLMRDTQVTNGGWELLSFRES